MTGCFLSPPVSKPTVITDFMPFDSLVPGAVTRLPSPVDCTAPADCQLGAEMIWWFMVAGVYVCEVLDCLIDERLISILQEWSMKCVDCFGFWMFCWFSIQFIWLISQSNSCMQICKYEAYGLPLYLKNVSLLTLHRTNLTKLVTEKDPHLVTLSCILFFLTLSGYLDLPKPASPPPP